MLELPVAEAEPMATGFGFRGAKPPGVGTDKKSFFDIFSKIVITDKF